MNSGWTQEQLAAQLAVSFPALNAWINGRAVPRTKAQTKINALYISIVGTTNVSTDELHTIEHDVLTHRMSAKQIVSDEKLLDNLTLQMTYHTNTIEGSTMTLADVEDVLFEDKTLANRTVIEQLEARNHRVALYWLLDLLVEQGTGFHLTEEILLGLHLRLMNGIVGDAGTYRRHTVRIMGTHVPLANWLKVPELVHKLLENSADSKESLIERLALTHATFEQIHPFSDGNGRTGRLILLAQALHAGYVPPLVTKERKKAYYKCLEAAQLNENYVPLEYFVAESMKISAALLNKSVLK